MKKTALIIFSLLILFIISGCGQQMDVTVYNANPMYGAEWIAINAHTTGHDQWLDPTGFADQASECDSTNSMTFKGNENEPLAVSANGMMYNTDANGNTTLVAFSVPVTSQTLYSEFLSQPHWYAEVNLQSVIFFKK